MTRSLVGAAPRARATAGLALVALALAGLTACGSSTPTDGRPSIVASTNVWGDIAETVGGPEVHVKTIIGNPATDPHDYESTPSDVAAIAKADLVVYNGDGYDQFAQDALKAAPGARAIDAFSLDVPDAGLGTPRSRSDDNEHIWYDLSSVDAVANAIAAELGQIEPAKASVFEANAQALHARLVGVADRAAQIKTQVAGRQVLQTEPVAHYLLRQVGLVDVAPQEFSEAIEQGTDPSPSSVARIDSLLKSHSVSALVYNSQTESPTTSSVRKTATGAGLPVVAVTETLPAGLDYVRWVTGELDALGKAVGAR